MNLKYMQIFAGFIQSVVTGIHRVVYFGKLFISIASIVTNKY